MKKITLLLLLTLSILGAKGQTVYQLNYDSIRVGKTTGLGGTSLYGKVYFRNVTPGLVRLNADGKLISTTYVISDVTGLQAALDGKVTVSPGAAQTGFINMSGAGTFGTTVSAANVTSTGDALLAGLRITPNSPTSGEGGIVNGATLLSIWGKSDGFAIKNTSGLATNFSMTDAGTATFLSSVTASSLIKSGGTASQFLKADGSVDATSYAPANTETLATVTGRGATTTTLSTFNGGIAGTSATFSGKGAFGGSAINTFTAYSQLTVGDISVANNGLTIASSTTGAGLIEFADGTTGSDPYRGFIQYGHSADAMYFGTTGTTKYTIDAAGNNTWTGSGTFSGRVNANDATSGIPVFTNITSTSSARYQIVTSGGGNSLFGSEGALGGELLVGAPAYATILGSGSTKSLVLGTNSTARYTIDASGNNTWTGNGAFTGTISASNLTSGTYTPTLTNGTNTASSTAGNGSYTRVGNRVFGYVDFSATGTGSLTGIVNISLPISSNFTAESDLTGSEGILRTGENVGGTYVSLLADITNDNMQIAVGMVSSPARVYRIHYEYIIK